MEEALRPHKRQRSLKPACPCPICLDHVLAKQGFALPCCNAKLAKGERRQRIHKTCFFAYARSVFEQKVKQRHSLMFMPEKELQSMLSCPRCRSNIPIRRHYMEHEGHLITEISSQGTVFVESMLVDRKDTQAEDTLFYTTHSGVERPATIEPPLRYCRRQRAKYVLSKPQPHIDVPENQKVLGLVIKD